MEFEFIVADDEWPKPLSIELYFTEPYDGYGDGHWYGSGGGDGWGDGYGYEE